MKKMSKVLISRQEPWVLKYPFSDENDKNNKLKQFEEFIKKHNQIVSEFPEKSFYFDEEGIFFNPNIDEVESGFPNGMSRLLSSDINDGSNFSLGVNPFSKDFYNDFYDLLGKEKEDYVQVDGKSILKPVFGVRDPDGYEEWSLTITGTKIIPSMSGTICFKRDGIEWDIDECDDDW